ncbi:hypothetical protein [Arenibacter sp. ARW7G5Y1]|uniref:hypothetical protein n=1 Tax=Arenibacter sp. ARW7G5Y1 TaxID=2135619 RepID=UPI000D752B36|nr:hypothetical protein [Arenibacter sp. ARW7G5Y1]PXX31221.1 hypothetical protein C7972_10156 [Arenibacter sp. ARW7G5Y1]
MKTNFLRIVALTAILAFASCSKEEDSADMGFDGSLTSIEDFYTPELVRALDSLGFEMNLGNKPPKIEGTYHVKPMLLKSSSVPGDIVGSQFNNYEVTFSNQDNGKLTIDYFGDQGVEIDEGYGSFISGENDKFSVFLITTSDIGSYTADSAISLSGRIVEGGIENIQMAFVMLDNKENEGGVFIGNNTGRIVYDSDYFSEKVENTKELNSMESYGASMMRIKVQ